MYHSTYHPRKRSGIILPFFILVVIGLIFVLGFQLWSYFKEKNLRLTENKAAMTIISGDAEVMVWSENKWVKALTGAVIREGDSIRVFPNSRISLALLNGSFLRAGADSEFAISELRSKNNQDIVTADLKYGDLWLKKTRVQNAAASFAVQTENADVRAAGTAFSVSKRNDVKIRVMEGSVAVDIKEKVDSKYRKIETLQAGIGQEIIIGDKELKAFRERKEADYLFAISDDFRNSDWYAWNASQDKSSQTLTVAQAVKLEKEKKTTEETISQPKTEEKTMEMPTPEIIEPDTAHRSVTADRIVVKGITSDKTQKIMVKTFVGGKEDKYALQKYTPQSTQWLYIAAEAYGSLVPGENRYEIIAIDKDGKESEPAELTLFYEKQKSPSDLSVPSVLTFNGIASNEIKADAIRVEGKIGKGIVKVYVDDFALTRYVPDSGAWVYYAKVDYGNLKDGENEYSVYGVDADAKKTPVLKFKIIKLPTE